MRQTVEEAAMNFANYESNNLDKLPFKVKNVVDYDNGLTRVFKAGAEWQAKQSPWISVEERLPEIVTKDGESDYMLVRYNDCIPVVAKYCTDEYHVCPMFKVGNKTYRSHWITPTYEWIKHNAIHYMPIPSFDEILEANKDVLERIKEKGD